jgi:cytochrome c-type biogenesis protein CcmH
MNRQTSWAIPALLLTLLVVLVPVTVFAELTQTEVSESLTCYACPGEPLVVDRCSGGDQMRAAIDRMLEEGKTKPEILDYFVAQFGDSILTTVPKKGFNLVAYTGPLIGLLVGIPVALLIIRRWGSAGRKQTAENGSSGRPAQLDEKTRQQIEKELSAMDEED